MNLHKNIERFHLKTYIRNTLLFLLLDQLAKSVVESGGDLGSIDCVNGKWQIDTKILSLIIVCPLQISLEALMCVFKRLGLYNNGTLNEDLGIYLCSLLPKQDVIRHCIEKFNGCVNSFGGLGALNEITMAPMALCIWQNVHEKMNCTV